MENEENVVQEEVQVEEPVVTEQEEVVAEPTPTSTPEPLNPYDQGMRFAEEQRKYEQLAAENAQLKMQLDEARAQANNTAEAANQNFAEQLTNLPTIDYDSMAYASDEDRVKTTRALVDASIAMGVQKGSEAAEKRIMDRIAPLLKQYDESVSDNEFRSAMEDVSKLPGFERALSDRDEIMQIGRRPEFSSLDAAQRAVISTLVYNGMHPVATAQAEPMDMGQRVDKIFNDPELMKAIEARRIASVEAKNTDIPVHNATGSLSSTVYEESRKPESIQEIKESLGLY